MTILETRGYELNPPIALTIKEVKISELKQYERLNSNGCDFFLDCHNDDVTLSPLNPPTKGNHLYWVMFSGTKDYPGEVYWRGTTSLPTAEQIITATQQELSKLSPWQLKKRFQDMAKFRKKIQRKSKRK